MVDTGASKRSTWGYGQFLALQRQDSAVQLNIATQGMVNVQFGIGSTSLISSARVSIPIGTVEFYIVKVNTPFLLCLADMDNLQVYFNNLKNLLITPRDAVPVVRRYGHPFLLWGKFLSTYFTESFNLNLYYLTNVELKRLYRRFGHPSVERLARILDRSGHEVNSKTLKYLT